MRIGKAVGAVFVVMAVLISGCATYVPTPPLLPGQVEGACEVSVDSLAARDADLKTKTYVISSAMQNVSDSDLQFQEFARYVENALSQKGYVRKNKKEGSDLIVSMAYRVGVSQKTAGAFMRILILDTYDLKDAVKGRQLWKTTLRSEGSMEDLRLVMPYMLTAGVPYLGGDSVGEQKIMVQGRDPMVLEIRK